MWDMHPFKFKRVVAIVLCACMTAGTAWAARPKKRMKTRPMTTTRSYPGVSKEAVSSIPASKPVPVPPRVIVSSGGMQTTASASTAPQQAVRREKLPAAVPDEAGAASYVPATPHKPAVTVVVDPHTGTTRTE